MENRIAENIRALRKARGLTQEQLSEVLGVTVGAVYKWEARLSQPELSTIMELADFFDTSVDALLGFEFRDNRLSAQAARLREYCIAHDRSGLQEAEKALKKYPHAFDIMYGAANLYFVFATESHDEWLCRRALELMEGTLVLIAQNTDPKINESVLYGKIAKIRIALGKTEQALALLKAHNAGGMFSDVIALTLAGDLKRAEEAHVYLADALLLNTAKLVQIALGYVNAYFIKKQFSLAAEMLNWATGTLSGLKNGNEPCFLDKVTAMFGACLAYAQLEMGDEAAARASLKRAKSTAKAFDAHPDYSAGALKFIENAEPAGIYDDIGQTALAGVEKTVRELESARLSEIWKEVKGNEAQIAEA